MPAKKTKKVTNGNTPPRTLTLLLAILTIILALVLWLISAKATAGGFF